MERKISGQTPDVRSRLTTAQWVFERHLAWIAAAEVKVGVIVAIDTALLGGLAAAFNASGGTTTSIWPYFFTITAAGITILGLFCAALVVLPRTNGPKNSLLFFGKIAALDAISYSNHFKAATDEQLLEDWTKQIHRNAQIALDKYKWVRRSMTLSFISVAPWIAAISLLVNIKDGS